MSDKYTPEAGGAVVLTLRGSHAATPLLPACLTVTGTSSRSAQAPDGDGSAFFPPGFLIPRQTIKLNLSAPRRGDPVPVTEQTVSLTVAPDDLVVLELADGGVFITLGERLQGHHLSTLPLETRASATARGLVSDAVQEQVRRLHVLGLGRSPSDDGSVVWLGDQAESLFDGYVVGPAMRWIAKPAARLGMAAVTWAIEQRLLNGYGLRRWRSDTGLEEWPLPEGELTRLLPGAGKGQPLLIFLHELGSNTLGSFGALQGTPELVELGRRFSGGIYGFDHPTLSCSPIENAQMLVDLLPPGAHISLVTHGRGGLVGDLLCLHEVDDPLLDEGDRADLGALLKAMQDKGLTVHRYLRVASPAAGTQLLGESLDGFLSAVLSVVGSGANLLGPWAGLAYGAFKRLVIEMVRHRADPELVPGLAPLMPGSKLAALLQSAKVQAPLQMAVMAGDTNAQEGLLRSLGLWLLDKRLFGSPFHDWVVDAPSMLAGIAKEAKALARLDARPEVQHFRYFQHAPNVRALKDWLCEDKETDALPGFESLEAVLGQMQLPHQKSTSTDARTKRSLPDADEPSNSDTSAETPRLLRSTLRRKLTVSVHAADLRFLPGVLMVGHYEQDPIAGPQAVLDRELLEGLLTERHSLGLYPGPIGSALAVLPKEGDTRRGAVIVGLGRFEKPLTRDGLTEAVMAGVLRYLLQVSDCHGPALQGLALNTLLIGTNSASSLSMGASVEALVRGVLEANARFHDTTRQDLHVDTLRIVELYLDTAITAAYALNETDRQQTLRTAAAMLDTQLVCAATLEQHDGARPRLFDGAAAGGNYWPRLMVTDARRSEGGAEVDDPPKPKPSPSPTQPAAVATWLRYLHLGQRARVETVEQRRQPGLVEQLVRQQIQDNRWNPEAGRALFHLMVPHALKDTLRQFQQLVVVVDEQTANMPWELVVADDPGRAGAAPCALALRMPLVRQLVTAEYRQQLRQSTGRAALVIGNPALDGFSEHFVNEKGEPLGQPADLAGAADEAIAVAAVLRAQGHDVTLLADDPPARAADVVMALYRQPWRILHVCAHGGFALRSVDGVALTGVLLSDGAVITAAEIQAMEMVPELVFLNCCHLGQMTAPARAGSVQRLAASLARELIGVGVRCVVVAGWAVSDWPAQRFGEVFYDRLLGPQGLDFGRAVFEARKEARKVAPQDITWGAYQAYGDPGWRAHRPSDAAGRGSTEALVSLDELLDKLAQLRVVVTEREKRPQRAHQPRVDPAQEVKALLDRCDPDWLKLPQVQSALGGTWFALGDFARAETAFRAALRGDQEKGVVPVRHIELLANALTRRAPQLADAGDLESAQRLVDEAINLLDHLDQLAFNAQRSTHERGGLKGSALKRRAELLLKQAPVDTQKVRDAVTAAVHAYERSGEKPYQRLNALSLKALVCTESERPVLARRVRACGKAAQKAVRDVPTDSWNAVMVPEALMVEWLLVRATRAPALELQVHAAYQRLFREVLLKPVQRDSMRTHVDLLAKLARALDRPELAERLKRLQPVLQ